MIRKEYLIMVIIFYEACKYSVHAEKDAITKIRNKSILKKCKIYVIKIKNEKIEQALPCPMCCDLLRKYGVERICCLSKI